MLISSCQADNFLRSPKGTILPLSTLLNFIQGKDILQLTPEFYINYYFLINIFN